MISPRTQLDVLDDEPDHRVLECAVAVKADSVVNRDKTMLQLGE